MIILAAIWITEEQKDNVGCDSYRKTIAFSLANVYGQEDDGAEGDETMKDEEPVEIVQDAKKQKVEESKKQKVDESKQQEAEEMKQQEAEEMKRHEGRVGRKSKKQKGKEMAYLPTPKTLNKKVPCASTLLTTKALLICVPAPTRIDIQ